MSNTTQRRYAAERIRELAKGAVNELYQHPVHTNEVFVLIKKHGIRPKTRSEYWKDVREQKKDRFFINFIDDPLPSALAGNIAGFRADLSLIRSTKAALITARATELADALVLGENTDTAQALRSIKAFIKATA